MKNSLDTFMENVEMINKDLSIYKDEEKGSMYYLNTVHLLTRVDRLELDKDRFMIAKFEEKIDNLKYDIIKIQRPIPKNEITKKEEDKYTLVNQEVSVRLVFNVSNSAGFFKSFINKKDAIKYAEEINKKVIEKLGEK